MVDAVFGPLTFRIDRWHGTIRYEDREIGISLGGDWRGPESNVRSVAVGAIEQLALLERQGRAFLMSQAAIPSAGTLIGVAVFRPAAEWLCDEFARNQTFAASGLSSNSPIVILTFALPNDQNVCDAVFFDSEPVTWDYH